MTTYYKSTTVWDKDSFSSMPAGALSEIAVKKAAMISAGTMHEQEGFIDNETTVTILSRFNTQAAADEWTAFVDGIATANSLDKISSRITVITQP